MKGLFSIVLTLFLFFNACGSTSSENNISQTADLQARFYKKFKGKIGDISITMNFTKNKTNITGNYYYNNIGIPLSISGEINSSNEFKFVERNDKYEETGIFSGKFISPDVIEGVWMNPKTKKTLNFTLSEAKDNSASISYKLYRKENCKTRQKTLSNPIDEENFNSLDTTCSYIEINLINVEAENIVASDLVNNSIEKIFINQDDKKYKSITEFVSSIDKLDEGEYLYVDIDFEVLNNENNILSFSLIVYTYEGGNHPNMIIKNYNYNLKSGNKIKLENIFKPNSSEKLNRIAEKIFIETHGSDMWDFESGKFTLNNNFALTPTGIMFQFNQYEIGPYAAGAPVIFIPFNKIEDLLIK